MFQEEVMEESMEITSAPLAEEELEDTLLPTGGLAAAGGQILEQMYELQDKLDTSSVRQWDPLHISNNETQPSAMCLQRIRRDLMSLYEEPPYGVFAVQDENQCTLIHALVIGPYDTPYEGGFFYFVIRTPPDYPITPPRVRLITTGDNTVRFNPNLYRNGKVCLSILGTWAGPSWSPAQSLTSVLVSIQSLLCETPYHNEPGYDKEHRPGDARAYSNIIEHETIRVAVCGVLEDCYESDRRCPAALKDVMKRSFPQFYDHYVRVCRRLAVTSQGAPMLDPFGDTRGRFDLNQLMQRLEVLKKKSDSGWTTVPSLTTDVNTADVSKTVNDNAMEI